MKSIYDGQYKARVEARMSDNETRLPKLRERSRLLERETDEQAAWEYLREQRVRRWTAFILCAIFVAAVVILLWLL